ncbi:MAG: RDD family protein [Planctomycetota bacterium]|nr:RDD family protein [Planctomycetota bacterium]
MSEQERKSDPLPSEETEEGVIYADRDQLSLAKRYAIVAVDVATLLLLCWLCTLLPFDAELVIVACLAVAILYLVVLKRSPVRTVGYRVMNARIVDLKGSPPSYCRMAIRLCIMQLSIGNPLLDCLWSSFRNQRTMRDMIAGTYVIRADAQPVGRGPIRPTYLHVLSYAVFYREVVASSRDLDLQPRKQETVP